MAHLDLDTDDLAAAGRRAHTAAERLHLTAATEDLVGTDASWAAGDPLLAAAIDDLVTAWGPTRTTLVATLTGLGDRLAHAAATFDAAEGTTARRVAGAVLGEPVHRTDGAG